MWFRSLSDPRKSHAGGSSQRPGRRPAASRLLLETLEDRTLPSFLAPVNYPVGTGPAAVVAANLRGNDQLDLVTANVGDNTISVQLANTDGTFQSAQAYGTGAAPVSLAVGDFNGDGKLDVATANEGDNTVSVLLGNGDGTFGAAKNYAVGSQPVSIAVGNFDGKLDLVTANLGDGTVSLLPGNGDGTFGLAKSIASLGTPAASVAVGDLNGDGKLDLAVATRGTDGYWWSGGWGYYGYYGGGYVPGYFPAVTVLMGNGSGTFTAGSSYTLPSPFAVPPSSFEPPSVTAADLNGDGKLDLVTTDAGDGLVSVLLNNGSGAFTGPTSFNAGDSPESAAVADLNGDAKLDLVTAGSGGVSVLPGDGSGAFGSPALFTAGTSPASVATGDFNGDGRTDLAVANIGSNNISVLSNTGYWPTLQATAADPVTGGPISSTTAGQSFNLTVTALDPFGNVLTGFTDKVSFSTWDAQATVIDPATGNPVALQGFSYTFTAADHGTHTFLVALKTAGTQSIAASDPAAGVTVSDSVAVNPGAVSSFAVSNFPSPISAGEPSWFSVTAYDAYGNLATNYAGTVVLSSTDPAAAFSDADTGSPLSGNSYTFQPYDYGTHYFYAVLGTIGYQSITATDASVTPAATGSQTGIQVLPTVTITGPSASYLNQTLTYTLGVIGEPAKTVFTYQIDWNGDGTVDQTVTGTSGITVTHSYGAAGYSYIGVTAIDPNNLRASTSQYVNVLPISVAIQADPALAGQQMLVITDTGYGDNIQLSSAASNGVSLTVDGYNLGTFTPTTSSPFALVMVFGGTSYNTLDARNLAISSVLVGGAGNDTLYGGTARNLLIGGAGYDTLYAGSAGDILIGGTTSYSSNVTALAYIMAEWDSGDSYSTRVSKIGKGGGLNGAYVLNSTTVSNDNVTDWLYGGAGTDWFIAHLKGRKNADKVSGKTGGEVTTNI